MKNNTSMFPVPEVSLSPGASRVQWLAGLAMQSLILRLDSMPDSVAEREEIALWSYRMAQAMQKTEEMLGIDDSSNEGENASDSVPVARSARQ